jgi:pimeloyl-ACP methyl ester carboxylesterase
MIQFVDTPVLRIAYRTGGDKHATPLLLLHGWPDDASTFDGIAPTLQHAGWRTY